MSDKPQSGLGSRRTGHHGEVGMRYARLIADRPNASGYLIVIEADGHHPDPDAFEKYVDTTVKTLLLRAGYRIARVADFGKWTMQVFPFEKPDA